MKNMTIRKENTTMENIPASQKTTEQDSLKRKSPIQSILISLLVNAILPYVIYTLLKKYTTTPDIIALALTGVPSLLDSLVGIIIRRRIDTLAAIVLFGIAISIGTVALGGSPKLLLVRESFLTSISGVVLLLSLLLRKPIGHYVFRHMFAGNNPERIVMFNNAVQKNAPFRMALRVLTTIWGVGLLLEGLARVYMAFTLDTASFLAVSPIVSTVIIVLTFGGTGLYVRQWRSKHGSIVTGMK